jgi:hypothetical protein
LLGDYLKGKRQKSGLSLKELADRTKIRLEYLKALESGEYGRIPGEVFVRGYIREYLRSLSFDPAEALSLYDEEKPPLPEPEVPVQSRNWTGLHAKTRYLLSGLIILILVPVAIFTLRFFEKPGQQSALKSTGVKSASLERVVKMIPEPIKTAEADFTNKHLLEIKAVEDSWVFLQIDDNISYSMLLRPGETRSWTGEKKFYLKTGNAGGIRITFDGRNLGAPGRRGRIAKLTLPSTPPEK